MRIKYGAYKLYDKSVKKSKTYLVLRSQAALFEHNHRKYFAEQREHGRSITCQKSLQ